MPIFNNLAPNIEGPLTPVGGVRAAADWYYFDGPYDPLFEAGAWGAASQKVLMGQAYGVTFETLGNVLEVPFFGYFVAAYANGTNAIEDVVALGARAIGLTDNSCVFGANILAAARGGDSVRLVGMEIDLEADSAFNLAPGSNCLLLNIFNKPALGAFIQTAGLNGGSMSNFAKIGGIDPNGAGISMENNSETIGSLVNSGSGVFTYAAIYLGIGAKKGIAWDNGGIRGGIFMDSSEFTHFVAGAGSWVYRDSTDTNTLISINPTNGEINMEAGGAIKISSVTFIGKFGTSNFILPSIAAGDSIKIGENAGDANPIYMWVNGSSKNVTQGAADSGGVGFRVLRVPN